MSFEKCLSLAVTQYAASNQHKAVFGCAPSKSEHQVQGLLTDLLAQLEALGAKVNWQVVLANLWTGIGMLYSGKSVAEVVAWLISLFAVPTPVVP